MARRWRLLLRLLRAVPHGAVSRATGWLAERRLPRPLRGPCVRLFARAVGADLEEAAGSPEDYPSISAFFTRRLRPGLRGWPGDPLMPGSPVDGVVGRCGRIEAGRVIQAKGLEYTVAELLACTEEAERFADAGFVTLYLAPRHYHRIHAPVTGAIRKASAVPGALFPVNEASVATVERLFPRNERLVLQLEGEELDVAVVAVGAFNVGRISAVFDPGWGGRSLPGVTNLPGRAGIETRLYRPPVEVARGQELMAFHLGSTVVLLLSGRSGRAPDPRLEPGQEIRLGDPLLR